MRSLRPFVPTFLWALVLSGFLAVRPASAQPTDAHAPSAPPIERAVTHSGEAPPSTEASHAEALSQIDSLRGAGAFEEAIVRLDSLRALRGDRVDVLWRLVFARIRVATVESEGREETGPQAIRYERALDDARAALRVDSSRARAHLATAIAEGRLALSGGTQTRVERARAVRRHVDRALALDPTLAAAYHVRGRWHRRVSEVGRLKRALANVMYGGLPDASLEQSLTDFQQAIALDDRAYHHLELAKTYLKMGRKEPAREALHTVLIKMNEHPLDPLYKNEARRLLGGLE